MSSRSGSYGPVGDMVAATRADSRDSIAASAAIAAAAPASDFSAPRSTSGSAGAGSSDGSSPICATSTSSSPATIVTTITAVSDSGMDRWIRQDQHHRRDCSDHRERGQCLAPLHVCDDVDGREQRAFTGGCGGAECGRNLLEEDDRGDAEGEPSITGHGMNVTARPRPTTPATSTIRPDMMVTIAMLPIPCSATIGARITAIAPVGPTPDVRSAEDRGHQPRDDGGDEPGGGAHTGRDAECQRQR